MDGLEELVVQSIFETFEQLPSKSKPRALTNNQMEWVPLSGIAIVGGASFPI